MPVKIRLQRHGKKGKPFFWIIAADSRAKRDGKYLEKLGIYNPTSNPATIELDVDSAVKWLQNGAQPTDTARAILRYKGAMLKNHLAGGVRKGAITEEQAEEKFQEWSKNKTGAIDAKKEGLSKEQKTVKTKALEAEKEANAKREAGAKAIEDEAKATAEKEAEIAKEQEEGVNSAASEPVIDEDNVKASAKNEIDTKTSDEASAKQKVEGTENSEK